MLYKLLCSSILAGSFALAQDAAPKNIILFIGDGMGPQQVLAAQMYHGAPLSFESLPYQALCTTHSANASVTDSAAAATAIATGVKVNNSSGAAGLGYHSHRLPPHPSPARSILIAIGGVNACG